jgi:ribosome-associated protein
MDVIQEVFSLEGREHIALHQLLKLKGWCSSGAEAKQAIDAGKVLVGGAIELRKRCKIKASHTVIFENHCVSIIA